MNLFALATHWKCYVKGLIGEYLSGDVLEVGAGIGGTTAALHDGSRNSWVCLEPDLEQAQRLQKLAQCLWSSGSPSVVAGSLAAIASRPCFDCILYIDVLEHISQDRAELAAAAKLLRKGGHLIVLSPAHQWLFSEFDQSVGHLRRYNKKSLRQLLPPGCHEQKLAYLDAAGLFLSLGNAVALKQRKPSLWQIQLWDKVCIPISRLLDAVSQNNCGKSILGVWQKAE